MGSLNDKQFSSYAGSFKNAIKRVNDVSQATTVVSISGETVSFSAGAVGTTGTTNTAKAAIMDANGCNLGEVGNTSISWTTGTVITTEVSYDYKKSDAEQVAGFSNGYYAVDYDSGKIIYKKATTGTSDTIAYKVRSQEVNLAGVDVEIGAVELKNAGTDDRATVTDANTARTTATHVLSTQEVGADGTVPPTGSLVTNAPFAKITDGTDTMDVLIQDSAFGTTSKGLAVFGKYEATPTTYTDGDAAPVLLDANGRIVLSSDIEIGGVEIKDGTTDNRSEVKAPNTAAVGFGLHTSPARYMATPPTLTDTYSAPLLLDSTGKLTVSSANTEYIDDGTGFTVASSKGQAVMAIATSDSVDANDVGALRMTVARNLGIDITTKDGSAWAVNNAINATIGDGTTVPVVETAGTKKALNVNVSDGTNDMPTMDAAGRQGYVAITDGTDVADVIVQDAAFGTASKGIPVFGKYEATPTTYTDGDAAPVLLDANGRIVLSSDIEIGAVELKNAGTDDRADIGDANVGKAVTTHVLAVQEVGADGTVPPTGSLVSNAPFTKITDGTDTADVVQLANGLNIHNSYALPVSAVVAGRGSAAATSEIAASAFAGDADNFDGNTGLNTVSMLCARVDDNTVKNIHMEGTNYNLYVENRNGANSMPAMDANSRAGFVQLTDGTNEVDVIGTINSAKTDTSSIAGTATSTSYGASGAGVQRVALARDARTSILHANYISPQDGSVAYTSNVTVTCSGFPFTVDDGNCTVTYIQIKPTGGTWGASYVNGMDGVSLIASANVITIAGAGTPFAASDAYRVGIRYSDKTIDMTTDSSKVIVQNPNVSAYVDESIVDTTNVATGTYYPASTGMSLDGYQNMTLTGKLIDGAGETTTLTVEVMNDEDTASGDWVQIYGYDAKNNTSITSVAATNQTTTFKWDFDNLRARYVRFLITATAATNTVIVKAHRSY